MAELKHFLVHKLARELRDTWQGRVLAATENRPLGAVVISVLAHNYENEIEVLLRVIFPGFEGLKLPGLCSAGKISRAGAVVADMIRGNGTRVRNAVLFHDEMAMRDAFRRLADSLKLSDAERRELFACVQKWVVCDYRLDPTMDPRDPEAKRLVVN